MKDLTVDSLIEALKKVASKDPPLDLKGTLYLDVEASRKNWEKVRDEHPR